MRKYFFIASLISMVFFSPLSGLQRASCAVLLDRIVATVNEEVITWSELMNVIVIDGRQFLGSSAGEEREAKVREMERPVLNSLIEMKLQLRVARKMGLEVSEAEIDGAIDEIRDKFNLSGEALMNSLQAEGLSLADYRARLADQILLQKVINIAVRNNVVISDAEIKQYYEDNRQLFEGGEKLKIRQIFFAMPGDDAQKEALESRAGELLDRIRRGEEFALLAREYSEDPSSTFGGDLGYITRGSILKEIEDTAGSLQKGEVSGPFWSPAGLHIIKLEDRIEGGSLDVVRDRIKDALFQTSFEKKYREWRAELRENAHIEIKL